MERQAGRVIVQMRDVIVHYLGFLVMDEWASVHDQISVDNLHIERVYVHLSAFNHQILRFNLHIAEFNGKYTQFNVGKGFNLSNIAYNVRNG